MGNTSSRANRKGIVRSAMGFEDYEMAEGVEGAAPMAEGFCGGSRITGILMLAALFVAFTPGVLVRLGSGYGKYAVAAIHAVLFAIVLGFIYDPSSFEGFQANKRKGQTCKNKSECASNKCIGVPGTQTRYDAKKNTYTKVQVMNMVCG